jgi:hypothetical protein
MTRSLRRAPVVLALLLPVITFLVIGRASEIEKATRNGQTQLLSNGGESDALIRVVARRFGLSGGSSAGAGIGAANLLFSSVAR